MTHLFSRRWQIVGLILIYLLVLSACQTLTRGSPASTPTSPETTPTSPVVTQSLVLHTPGVMTMEEKVVYGPSQFSLQDPKAGLADLTSYKATLRLAFNGTQAGKTQQWSKTYVMLSSNNPLARQVTIEKSGDNSDPDPVFMAEVNGAAYERRGTNVCNATVIDPGNSLTDRWEPAGFLTGVIGAEKTGIETVNGVPADHYTFDEHALGQLGTAKSTGEMWVASAGGTIVKYVFTTKGDANYFGEGIEGTLTGDYELTDANQPVTIQLPKDCPAGMVKAPPLPDASNVQNVPGLLTYDTSTSLADAATFYQKQIPGLGWTLLGEPVITDTTVLLHFTQGDQQMMVIITTGDGGTKKVHIELGSSQK